MHLFLLYSIQVLMKELVIGVALFIAGVAFVYNTAYEDTMGDYEPHDMQAYENDVPSMK